jgi:hypothetical protein
MSIRSLSYKKDSDLVDETQEDMHYEIVKMMSWMTMAAPTDMTFRTTSSLNKNDDSFHLLHEAYTLLYISLSSVTVQLSVRAILAGLLRDIVIEAPQSGPLLVFLKLCRVDLLSLLMRHVYDTSTIHGCAHLMAVVIYRSGALFW